MRSPTPLEMSGIVNWDRASEFQKMTINQFNDVPDHQRCGAYRMIRDMSHRPMMDLRIQVPGPDKRERKRFTDRLPFDPPEVT